MEYRIVRSRRKTIGLRIDLDGLTVHAPMKTTKKDIERVIHEKEAWIKKHLDEIARVKAESAEEEPLTMEDIHALAQKAMEVLPGKVKRYADMLGVTYGRITIRNQRTKWGSCTDMGNLNFNCLLMMAPDDVVDSIVAHEVCHLAELNHSDRFYELLTKLKPDWQECEKWLNDHGKVLISRMVKGQEMENQEESEKW